MQNQAQPILVDLEREYEARISRMPKDVNDQGKARYGAEELVARNLFAEKVGADIALQQKVIEAIVKSTDTGFAHLALIEMIDLLARQDQAATLAELLSKRCPEIVFLNSGIEDYLIIICQDELTDGTLVLCDAYDMSLSPEVRRTIASALRRGFKAVGIVNSDDQILVGNCRKWYETHKDGYEPNLNYLQHFSVRTFSYEHEGVLVERKPAPAD